MTQKNANNTDKTTILTFGTFDHFHPGHEYYLAEAYKKAPDPKQLIVIIARDQTVEKVKGFKPTDNEKIRQENVANNSFVTTAILGDLDDPYAILSQIKPDLICLGYDQSAFITDLPQKLQELNLNPQIIRIAAHHPEKYKSSIIKNKNNN
jgi:FAD synthetase